MAEGSNIERAGDTTGRDGSGVESPPSAKKVDAPVAAPAAPAPVAPSPAPEQQRVPMKADAKKPEEQTPSAQSQSPDQLPTAIAGRDPATLFETTKVAEAYEKQSAELNKVIEAQLSGMKNRSIENYETYNHLKTVFMSTVNEYLRQSRTALVQRLKESKTSPQDIAQWNEWLRESTKDVVNYRLLVAGYVAKMTEGQQLTSVLMFRMARDADAILKGMLNDKKFPHVLGKAARNEKLTDEDMEYLKQLIENAQAHEKEDNALKLLRLAGVVPILSSMNSAQRLDFARFIVNRSSAPEKRIETVTQLVGAGYLSVQQGQELLGDGKELLEKMLKSKAAVDALMKTVQETTAERDTRNPIQTLFEPQRFLGMLGTIWGVINTLLHVVVYRSALNELPMALLPTAGVLAVSLKAMTPKGLQDWYTQLTNGKNLTVERAGELMLVEDQMRNNPDLNHEYFLKGGAGVILKLRKEKQKGGRVEMAHMTITIDEVIAQEQKEQPQNPERQAYLTKIKQEKPTRERFEHFAAALARAVAIQDGPYGEQLYADLNEKTRTDDGLAKKEIPKETPDKKPQA